MSDDVQCPHTPECPAGQCLPDNLRPTEPVPAVAVKAKPDDMTELTYITSKIDDFSNIMELASSVVRQLEKKTPVFEGSNLAPVAGVPLVGLLFVNRFNSLSYSWADCARLLREVLSDDSWKLSIVARNYRAAHGAAEGAVDKIERREGA